MGQIAKALEMIARVKPKVLVINGGDGTVQSALTELYHGGHFEGTPPPVAVLPNGKTNLIALDLGAEGSALEALERILEVAKGDLSEHIVARELIALSDGSEGARPVLGMFLGGAGLAETILYCRHKIYPLGLPNGISHLLAAVAVMFSAIFGLKADFLAPACSSGSGKKKSNANWTRLRAVAATRAAFRNAAWPVRFRRRHRPRGRAGAFRPRSRPRPRASARRACGRHWESACRWKCRRCQAS